MKTKTITLHTIAPSFVIIVAMIFSLQLKGQSLVEFDASACVGSPVPTECTVASIAPNLSSTSITRNNLTPVGTTGAFSSSNWPVSPAAAPAGDKYLTFTLTANPGYVLDLTGANISFACRRSGTGPNAVHIYTSVGGFSSAANSLITVTPIVAAGGTPVGFTFPNGGLYDNLFSIEIRIYADQASNASGVLRLMDPTSGGNIRITGGQVKPYAMSSLPCGAIYSKKSTVVNATYIPAAISYRFKFYNSTSGVLVGQRTQVSNALVLSTVPGLFYNNNYKWTVSVNIGFGYGPESNPNCIMTLAPAQTTIPCGVTYSSLNGYTAAPNPMGILNYRFTIYDNTTGEIVAQRTQSSNYFYLSSVSGLYYETTYKWTVACEYPLSAGGSAWGPESNPTCTMVIGPAMTSLLCGSVFTNMNSYTAVPAPNGVIGYRFTFYNNTTGVMVAQRTQSSNYLYFNTVSGLYYGTTYKWTVACEYPVSTGGSVFGPESNINCTVTFAPPTATVPCGNTYVLASGYTALTPVSGAVAYRFRFYQENVLMAEREQASNYIYFSQVAGLLNNQTYNWTVEVKYNTPGGPAYGPASNSSCAISFGSSARLAAEEQSETDVITREELPAGNNSDVIPELSVYPNPATEKITIVAGEPVLSTSVYSITGELLQTNTLANEIMVGDLAPGTYFILVQTESGVRRATFVKE